jgi:hypothetical protein
MQSRGIVRAMSARSRPRRPTAFVLGTVLLGAVLLAALGGCAAAGTATPTAGLSATPRAADATDAPASRSLPLTPRLQWLANYGYCGETALVTAAMGLGTYVSQYTARALASDEPQSSRDSQLLPGVNAVRAATALHLVTEDWSDAGDAPTTDAYLSWVTAQVRAGHPVLLGVYENQSAFGEEGDPEFDHVALATRVDGDVLTIDDNGLWNPDDWTPADPAGGTPPPYLTDIPLDAFARTREGADEPSAPLYSIRSDGPDYGTAIAGIADADGVALPVSLTASANYELPAMVDGADTPPAAMPLELTATVSGLTPGRAYVAYTYTDLASVPDRDVHAHAASAATREEFVASGATRTLAPVRILSSDTLVYRVVPAA